MQFLDDEENFGEQMSFFYFAKQYYIYKIIIRK